MQLRNNAQRELICKNSCLVADFFSKKTLTFKLWSQQETTRQAQCVPLIRNNGLHESDSTVGLSLYYLFICPVLKGKISQKTLMSSSGKISSHNIKLMSSFQPKIIQHIDVGLLITKISSKTGVYSHIEVCSTSQRLQRPQQQ